VVVSLIGNTLIILLLKKYLSLNSYLRFKQKCIIYHTNDKNMELTCLTLFEENMDRLIYIQNQLGSDDP
jgi:hypothetical protein